MDLMVLNQQKKKKVKAAIYPFFFGYMHRNKN